MQQTFYEVLQGHKIEFNRLMYPIHYHISTDDADVKGATFTLNQNETGQWKIMENENLPNWIESISDELHIAILENEQTVEGSAY